MVGLHSEVQSVRQYMLTPRVLRVALYDASWKRMTGDHCAYNRCKERLITEISYFSIYILGNSLL